MHADRTADTAAHVAIKYQLLYSLLKWAMYNFMACDAFECVSQGSCIQLKNRQGSKNMRTSQLQQKKWKRRESSSPPTASQNVFAGGGKQYTGR